MTACTKCGAEGHLLGAPENAGAVLTGATGAALCVYDRECDLRAELRDVTAERDALRRLPVIAYCYDCAHCHAYASACGVGTVGT